MKRGRFWLFCLVLSTIASCGDGGEEIPVATSNVVAAFQTVNNEIMDTISEIDPEAMALVVATPQALLQADMVADMIACTFGGSLDVVGDFTRTDESNANFALEMDYINCGTRTINGQTGITGTVSGVPPQTVLNYSFGGVPGPNNVITIIFPPNNSNCTVSLAGIEVTDTTVKGTGDEFVTTCEVTGFLDADCNIDGDPAVVDCDWSQLDCFNFDLLAQDNCTCNGSGCN